MRPTGHRLYYSPTWRHLLWVSRIVLTLADHARWNNQRGSFNWNRRIRHQPALQIFAFWFLVLKISFWQDSQPFANAPIHPSPSENL